jgi:hypothetical protein
MVDVLPGDLVCAHRSSLLGGIIANAEERCPCSLSYWGHAFHVEESDGTILNTLEHVVRGNLFHDYAGVDVLVGRFRGSDPSKVRAAIDEIAKDIGSVYPAWRLVADELDLGRMLHTGSQVCSERTVHFGYLAFGYEPFARWAGWTPGNLAFCLQYGQGFQVVYEGRL